MHAKVFYTLGQRDTIAGLFAMIRSKGINSTLAELAAEYTKAFDEPNPHVEWWIKQNEKKEDVVENG